MNLFLLAAVPLAAVVLHRLFHRERAPFAAPPSWILGSVWSAAALVFAAFFGKGREFAGSLGWTFAGLTFTDVLVVPGLVVAAWVLTRPKRDAWELGLWLALAFSFAGLRDFAATSRNYDLTEYFLVPLDRILVVLLLPELVLGALAAPRLPARILRTAAAALLGLTGALVPVLSFAGWGWLDWVLVVGGIGGVVGFQLFAAQKKAAPQGSGPSPE
jgi:hypothetical protein